MLVVCQCKNLLFVSINITFESVNLKILSFNMDNSHNVFCNF